MFTRLCRIGLILAIIAGLISRVAAPVDATEVVEFIELTNNPTNPNDRFGYSVDISGDLAIVGAPGSSWEKDLNEGSAYIFRFDGDEWQQETILKASNPYAGDHFGHAVAVSDNVAVVTALYLVKQHISKVDV
jgi:hypothetical protein